MVLRYSLQSIWNYLHGLNDFYTQISDLIKKSDESKFHEEIKNKFSKWIKNTLKDNNYQCTLKKFQELKLLADFSK